MLHEITQVVQINCARFESEEAAGEWMTEQAEVYARGGVDNTAIEEIKHKFTDAKRKGGIVFKIPARNSDEVAPAQFEMSRTRT
eukprot:5690183-Alexandrium_andersonii.AAC.1